MIQIRRENLDALAEKHFNNIKDSIEKSLNKFINERSLKAKALYQYLLENLKKVITSKPYELEYTIIEEVKTIIEINSIEWTTELDSLKSAFNYDTTNDNKAFTRRYPLKSDPERWGAYQLAKELHITVCPYCNRQTIYTIQSRTGKTRPEFDHFFNKADYPYLALSFYNLIPSCHICNSNLKGSKKFKLTLNIHPYIEGFENILRFKIELNKSIDFPNGKNNINFGVAFFYGNTNSFKIKIKSDTPTLDYEKKCNNNIDIFHIEDLYNEHKDYVYELVKKEIVYNEDYLESLYSQYAGTLFSSFQDVQRMALSNYISELDFDKRPLAKLTRDISEDLGLLPR